MKVYPSHRYHPTLGSKIVRSEAEDQALVGWFLSPADFGVETCPSKTPDPKIAEKREALKGKHAPEGHESVVHKIGEIFHHHKEAAPKTITRKAKP